MSSNSNERSPSDRVARRSEVPEETVLTPADVAALCGCTVRIAFGKMREAGAVAFGRSLRITRTKFLAWLDNEGRRVKASAPTGVLPFGLLGLNGRRSTKANRRSPSDEDELEPVPTCRTPRKLPTTPNAKAPAKPRRKARA
jgi:hypothetical protein